MSSEANDEIKQCQYYNMRFSLKYKSGFTWNMKTLKSKLLMRPLAASRHGLATARARYAGFLHPSEKT
jgi:hypothetical protein